VSVKESSRDGIQVQENFLVAQVTAIFYNGIQVKASRSATRTEQPPKKKSK
jgi:hypothetical protein